MRCVLILQGCLALLWPGSIWARSGVVQTKDGQVLRGQIRLWTNGVSIINAAKESAVTVSLGNLSDLFFDSEPELRADRFAKRTRQAPTADWQAEDIGSANSLGSVQVTSGLFRVRSVGTNIAA